MPLPLPTLFGLVISLNYRSCLLRDCDLGKLPCYGPQKTFQMRPRSGIPNRDSHFPKILSKRESGRVHLLTVNFIHFFLSTQIPDRVYLIRCPDRDPKKKFLNETPIGNAPDQESR